MKYIPAGLKYVCFFLLICNSFCLFAQNGVLPDTTKVDTTIQKNDNPPVAKDTTLYNHYGDLLNDNPRYEKKYSVFRPAIEVIGVNGAIHYIDRYIFNYDWSYVNTETWKTNIKKGWEWDTDRFGINFVGHPYSGSLYFNAARSNGYNYFESMPFAVGGSLMWEYFGENTRPSYNDIINTPVSGFFLGEVLFRISSNILDDSKRGGDRIFRELFATVINPMRGFNRLIQGKMWRYSTDDIYQKDLLNITVFGGIRKLNDGAQFGTGPVNEVFNLHIDYGNPFELRIRKPFDYFQLRTEFNFNASRKILDNIVGYGILTGRNTTSGRLDMLAGLFQYYHYWDNLTFELGALGFGAGLISKIAFKKSTLYFNFHLAGIPLAGNSTRRGPIDTTQFRDYDYGAGLEAQFEGAYDFRDRVTLTLPVYYYTIYTYVADRPENSRISVLKPRISVRLYKNLRLGGEELIYINNRYENNIPVLHLSRTEQKVFLLYYFENARNQKKFTK
jgi:hypothetical protein